MLARMRRALLLGPAVAACTAVTPPGLVLDVGRVCDNIALEVADADVLPGATIHAAAVVRSGGDAAWYLASDQGRLELHPVPEDMPAIDLSMLGEPREFHVQPGPVEGQVWLLHDDDAGSRVWRIDEEAALAGPALAAFPDAAQAWTRRVVFLGRSPHLVAIPRSSKVGTIAVEVAALTPELELGERWSLTATVECAPFSELSCPLYWEELRDVALLDGAEAGSISGAALLLAVTTPQGALPAEPEMPVVFETHILSVVLQLDPAAERPVLTRRDHTAWTTDGPVIPSPALIAADPLGLYVIAGLLPGPDTSGANATSSDYLFRADLLGSGTSDPGDVIALLPKALRSRVLQLGGRVALGQIVGSTWHVAPIEGVAVNEEIVGSLKIGDDAEVLRAGRGQFVVVGEGLASRRVRVVCDETDPPIDSNR
jgi:hypothetical protein